MASTFCQGNRFAARSEDKSFARGKPWHGFSDFFKKWGRVHGGGSKSEPEKQSGDNGNRNRQVPGLGEMSQCENSIILISVPEGHK